MGTKLFSDLITFTRASSATRVNSSGLVEAVASNQPRFDYDPVTLQPKGLLIEEQRTNLLTYSEQFDNAEWGKNAVTILANSITAPNGLNTADKIQETAVTNFFAVNQNPPGLFSTKYTWSCFAKAAERTFLSLNFSVSLVSGTFNLSTGANNIAGTGFVSASATSAGNGWWRLSVVLTTPASGPNILYHVFGPSVNDSIAGYAGTAGSGIYIWGAQIEAGAFPTSYIPTTTAAATRAADVATITGTNFSSWYNQTEGTLFTEASVGYAIPSSGFPVVASLNDGTSNNRIENGFLTTTLGGFEAVAGGAFQAGMYPGSSASLRKLAGTYEINDFAVCVNGGSVSTDTSGTIPVVDRLRLGERNSTTNSSNFLNGHIRRITYYPRRLTDAELQALTS